LGAARGGKINFEWPAGFAVKDYMKLVKSLAASCVLLLAALVALAEITKAPPGTCKVVGPLLFTNSILPEKKELALPLVKNRDDFSALPPGIYVTEPYACMVKVPGAVRDNITRQDVPVLTNSMPEIRPELRPVPAPGPSR